MQAFINDRFSLLVITTKLRFLFPYILSAAVLDLTIFSSLHPGPVPNDLFALKSMIDVYRNAWGTGWMLITVPPVVASNRFAAASSIATLVEISETFLARRRMFLVGALLFFSARGIAILHAVEMAHH